MSDSDQDDDDDENNNYHMYDEETQKMMKQKKKESHVKTDRHNFVSVDCNLTAKEMVRYGMRAPHLTTVLGRTSDLDHCPGIAALPLL